MALVPTFLINLDRSPDRLALMRAQARASGLRFERTPGLDGVKQVPDGMRPQFIDEYGQARGGLSDGEVGCYASHLLALSTIVERRLEAAIVLEDDALLHENFERRAQQAILAAPAGWDCIHLSTHFKRAAFPVLDLGLGHSLVRYARLPVNSVAYVVSLSGAAKLLAPRPRVRPYDMEFRFAWLTGLEVYGVYPALARPHEHLASTIAADWKAAAKVRRRGKSRQQMQWKPSLLSHVHGWLYVLARLGPAGVLHCWTAPRPSATEAAATATEARWVQPRLQKVQAS